MKQDNDDIKLIITPTLQEQPAVQEDVAPEDVASVEHEEIAAKTSAESAASLQGESAKSQDDEGDRSPLEEHSHRNTLENIVQEDAHESEVQSPTSFSLSRTLGGALLARVIQSQIKLMLLIFAFLIIYITCRYMCQQKMVEIDRLEQQLISVRYKATVFTSLLTEKSRESNIMNMLEQKGDSTLKVPTEPPYKINIPE